jgi:hypothetical protein
MIPILRPTDLSRGEIHMTLRQERDGETSEPSVPKVLRVAVVAWPWLQNLGAFFCRRATGCRGRHTASCGHLEGTVDRGRRGGRLASRPRRGSTNNGTRALPDRRVFVFQHVQLTLAVPSQTVYSVSMIDPVTATTRTGLVGRNLPADIAEHDQARGYRVLLDGRVGDNNVVVQQVDRPDAEVRRTARAMRPRRT